MRNRNETAEQERPHPRRRRGTLYPLLRYGWPPAMRIVLLIILTLISSGGTAAGEQTPASSAKPNPRPKPPITQRPFGSTVHAFRSPGNRRERVEGPVKFERHCPGSPGPDK